MQGPSIAGRIILDTALDKEKGVQPSLRKVCGERVSDLPYQYVGAAMESLFVHSVYAQFELLITNIYYMISRLFSFP